MPRNPFIQAKRKIRAEVADQLKRQSELEQAAELIEQRLHVLRDDALMVIDRLREDWHATIPRYGGVSAWFLVRDYLVDGQSRPAWYDPFWPREMVDESYRRRWFRKARAFVKAHGGTMKDDVNFRARRPFGWLKEARRELCPECGRLGFVVGYRDLFKMKGSTSPWSHSLYHLCFECPRLVRFAHREDRDQVILDSKRPE